MLMAFFSYVNITLIYTQTHTPSLEELISIFLLYPPRPLQSSGQLLERWKLSPRRDPRMGRAGLGWGGEDGKLLVGSGAEESLDWSQFWKAPCVQ